MIKNSKKTNLFMLIAALLTTAPHVAANDTFEDNEVAIQPSSTTPKWQDKILTIAALVVILGGGSFLAKSYLSKNKETKTPPPAPQTPLPGALELSNLEAQLRNLATEHAKKPLLEKVMDKISSTQMPAKGKIEAYKYILQEAQSQQSEEERNNKYEIFLMFLELQKVADSTNASFQQAFAAVWAIKDTFEKKEALKQLYTASQEKNEGKRTEAYSQLIQSILEKLEQQVRNLAAKRAKDPRLQQLINKVPSAKELQAGDKIKIYAQILEGAQLQPEERRNNTYDILLTLLELSKVADPTNETFKQSFAAAYALEEIATKKEALQELLAAFSRKK